MMQDAPWPRGLACHGLPLPFDAGGMAVDPLAQVAREARDGNVQAQRRLLEAVGPALLPPLRMILGPGHPDLEDVLQEALLGLLRGLASFRGESSVLHFARRVATKRAIEVCRRQRTTARKLEHARQLDVPGPPTGVPVNTVRSRLRLAKEALRRRIDTDPLLGELLKETS
jgi:RNA polymerase sigma-70 factor, ECF subfamily